MNRYLLLCAGLLGLGACSKDKPVATPAVAVSKAVGAYKCRVYFTNWQGGQPAATIQLHDSTLQVVRTDAQTVRIGTVSLALKDNLDWLGHAPARPNFSFAANYDYVPGRKVLQLELTGDSLYYEDSQSGRSYGQVWRFYGKK